MLITEKLHALKHTFQITVSPGKSLDRFVYSYLVFDDKITLIDSGIKGSEAEIYNYIRGFGKSIADIETLILSHAHPDHIGAANKIKKDTQCKVIAHEFERNWIEDIDIQNQHRPVPGFFSLVDEPVKVDFVMEDNETLSLGKNTEIKIMHTPGHSPGLLSICFTGEEILFTGDAIPLVDDMPNYDNYTELISSIQRIRTIKGIKTIISSWQEPISGASEISEIIREGESYVRKIDLAVQKIYKMNGRSKMDCCKAVIEDLNLPPVFVNPLVNKAFMSHL